MHLQDSVIKIFHTPAVEPLFQCGVFTGDRIGDFIEFHEYPVLISVQGDGKSVGDHITVPVDELVPGDDIPECDKHPGIIGKIQSVRNGFRDGDRFITPGIGYSERHRIEDAAVNRCESVVDQDQRVTAVVTV